jgi:L-ascorbate metabolism protein UlaG (beta-lactamase superfamily)
VLRSPGEYEVGGVFVTGVPTFHDARGGKELGQNVAFLFDFGGLTVCHLGDLGHVLTQDQVEALDTVNVLLVPVGGISTITPAKAAGDVAQAGLCLALSQGYGGGWVGAARVPARHGELAARGDARGGAGLRVRGENLLDIVDGERCV